MSASELSRFIGRKGYAMLVASSSSKEALRVDVEIRDAKSAFGRTDLLVVPVAGNGSLWMSEDKVVLYDEEGS